MSADPHELGPYRIVRPVGRGGMGVVYEAVHTGLEKRVALKVLPRELAADRLDRFLREAQTAAALHHTNIVPVFDVGQVNGIPYYAMQFIDGRGLDRVLKDEGVKGGDSEGVNAAAVTLAEASAPRLPVSAPGDPTGAASAKPQARDYFRWVADIGIQAAEGLAHAH